MPEVDPLAANAGAVAEAMRRPAVMATNALLLFIGWFSGLVLGSMATNEEQDG